MVGSGAFALWGEAEEMGVVQPGEEWRANKREDFSKKLEPGSSLRCMAGGWKAKLVNLKGKIQSARNREKLFHIKYS